MNFDLLANVEHYVCFPKPGYQAIVLGGDKRFMKIIAYGPLGLGTGSWIHRGYRLTK